MDSRKFIRRGFSLLHSCSKAIGCKTRMGFSLIEAAIVLGVVGLVIGGIWYAVSAIASSWRVNKAIEYITVIEQGTRAKMPIQTYTGNGATPYNHVAATLAAMKIIPEGFRTVGQHSLSPEGIRFQVRLEDANGNSVPDGPSILIDVFTENYYAGQNMTVSECESLIKNVLARNKNNPLFYKITVFNPSHTYTRSSDINSVVCPITAQQIYFIFRR